MNYVLLVASVIIGTLKNVFTNRFTSKNRCTKTEMNLFNTVLFLVGTIVFILGGKLSVSGYTIGMSVIFAAINITAQISCLKALECGSLSLTTLFTSCGMIISAMFGVFFYAEPFKIVQAAGMIFIILAAAAISNEKGDTKPSKKWAVYVITASLANGFIGVAQKIHQTSPHKNEINGFLALSFGIMTLVSLIMFAYEKIKSGKPVEFEQSKKDVMITSVITGALLAFLHKGNLYLSGALPGMLFFPFHNGGVIVFSAICSAVIFKEQLPKPKLIGIALGIAGVILLSI